MGWRTIGFAEIDPFAIRVLAKNFPGVPNYGDIGAIPDGVRADIVTAGTPCQPWSCAGKRMGHEDDRAIWPVALSVIKRVKPDYVVLENVAGFIGMALDGVLSDMEAEGYETGTVVLPACAVNAPHRRDRVWVVGHSAKPRSLSSAPPGIHRGKESAGPRHEEPQRRGNDVPDAASDTRKRENREPVAGKRETSGMDAIGGGDAAADADSEPLGRATEPRSQRGGGQLESGLGGVADGLPGGMDRHFDCEPDIPRIAKGVPDRASRLKALGNAIVPQVAYQIFRAMSSVDGCLPLR